MAREATGVSDVGGSTSRERPRAREHGRLQHRAHALNGTQYHAGMSGDDTSNPTAVERPRRDKLASGANAVVLEDDLAKGERVVANRYRLTSLLGRGGMGEVYVARDEMMVREVAVKCMLEAAPSDDAVERFLREARVQGRLDHPAIPPVYELARDVDGRPFFAMKRLVGTPLSTILRASAEGDPESLAAYPTQRLLRAYVEICNAVSLAHDRGVIHRDIKPGNIMLGDRGEVYLLDWGVAKVVGLRELASMHEIPVGKQNVSTPGIVIGTPGYMAPEQRVGDAVDHRADIYALGCVLFEILAGVPYNRRDPDRKVGKEDVTDTPARLATLEQPADARPSRHAPDRGIPPELDALCVAATQYDRDTRLMSAAQLASTVQRYLDGNRDLALRRDIARKHLTAAKAALAEGGNLRNSFMLTPTERDPRAAMREAGRALALDPTLTEAADLVGRLMLEPPKEVPPEVQRAIHDEALTQARKQALIGMIGYVGYLIFAFVLIAFGIGDARYAWTMVALSTASFAFSALGREWADSAPRLITVVALNAILIALIARMFSPVLCAPTAAVVTLMALVANPLLYSKRWVVCIAAALALAMLLPMAAEHAGWIPSTFSIEHGVLTIIAPSLGGGGAAWLGLAVFAVITLAVVAVMGRVRARTEDRARRELHLQAWWLRQLIDVPRGT